MKTAVCLPRPTPHPPSYSGQHLATRRPVLLAGAIPESLRPPMAARDSRPLTAEDGTLPHVWLCSLGSSLAPSLGHGSREVWWHQHQEAKGVELRSGQDRLRLQSAGPPHHGSHRALDGSRGHGGPEPCPPEPSALLRSPSPATAPALGPTTSQWQPRQDPACAAGEQTRFAAGAPVQARPGLQ